MLLNQSTSNRRRQARTAYVTLLTWSTLAATVVVIALRDWLAWPDWVILLVALGVSAFLPTLFDSAIEDAEGWSQWLGLITYFIATLVLPFATALQLGAIYDPGGVIDPEAYGVEIAAAALLACLLSFGLVPGASSLDNSHPVRPVVLNALVQFAIAFAALYFIRTWMINATWRDGPSWWLAQSVLVLLGAGILLAGIAVAHQVMWKQSTWAARDAITVTISAVALLVSIFAVIYPLASQAAQSKQAAEGFLRKMIEPSAFQVGAAKWLAEPGSPAHEFAERLERIWSALRKEEVPAAQGWIMAGGTLDSTFQLCFADVDVLPIGCATAENFVFSESGRVADFTLNRIPLRTYFEVNDLTDRSPTALYPDKPEQFRFVQVATLMGTDSFQTAIFRVWGDEVSLSELKSVAYADSADAVSNDDLTWNAIPAERGGISYFWALKMPRGTSNLLMCFENGSPSRTCIEYTVWG